MPLILLKTVKNVIYGILHTICCYDRQVLTLNIIIGVLRAMFVCMYITICNVPRTAHSLYIPYTIIYYMYVSIVCNLVIRKYIVMFT